MGDAHIASKSNLSNSKISLHH